MNEYDIKELVITSLTKIAPEADASELAADADLREELDLDSMDFLNFVTGLSEATGVEIPEREYPELMTIQACVDYLTKRA